MAFLSAISRSKTAYLRTRLKLMRLRWPKPLRGVVYVAKILWRDAVRTKLFHYASSMAYNTLFAVIPSLAVMFAIFSLFAPIAQPNANWFTSFRSLILHNLAPDTGQRVIAYLEDALNQLDIRKIGLTSAASLVISLIFLLSSVEDALNQVWEVSRSRSYLRRSLFFIGVCAVGAVLLTLGLELLAKWNWQQFVTAVMGEKPSSLATSLAPLVFFTLLYKITPNCPVRWRAAAAAALLATVAIRISSLVFAIYSQQSHFYANVYGALATLPLFLLWLYVGWVIILVGAIVSWRCHHWLGQGRKATLGLAPKSRPKVTSNQ